MAIQKDSTEISPFSIIRGARRNGNDEIVLILEEGKYQDIPKKLEERMKWVIEGGCHIPNLRLEDGHFVVRASEAAMKKILESVGFTVFF